MTAERRAWRWFVLAFAPIIVELRTLGRTLIEGIAPPLAEAARRRWARLRSRR